MDPIWNCATAVCCPPESPLRYSAIAVLLVRAGCDRTAAIACAPYVAKVFDLAPKGSLELYQRLIGEMAKAPHWDGKE